MIHLSSGTAAFVGAYWIGPRLKHDRENFQPNNIALMMVGAGILWIGWNGRPTRGEVIGENADVCDL